MGESLSLSPLHSRQWLEDALRENEAGSCFIFLVGTKKDLLVSRVALEVWVALGKMPSLSALIGGAMAGEGGGTVGGRRHSGKQAAAYPPGPPCKRARDAGSTRAVSLSQERHVSRSKQRPCTWPRRCRPSTGRCRPRPVSGPGLSAWWGRARLSGQSHGACHAAFPSAASRLFPLWPCAHWHHSPAVLVPGSVFHCLRGAASSLEGGWEACPTDGGIVTPTLCLAVLARSPRQPHNYS